MKRRHIFSPIAVLAAVLLVMACRPQPPPNLAPSSGPPPAPAPATVPTSNVSPLASQDAQWSAVVDAARKEGRLVVYGATPFANAGREVVAAFRSRYGISVDLLILGGRQQVEKLKVEQSIKQPIADIVQTGVSSATEIVLSDLAQSTVDKIPVLRDRSVFHTDPVYGPQQQIIAFNLTFLGPMINTNRVKPDEIKSWRDILDPKWKGKILISDPRSTGSGLNLFSTLTYHKALDYDYFRSLAKLDLVLWAGAHREAYLLVGRGEHLIDFAAGNTEVAPLILEGAPLKILTPEEGNTGQVEPVLMAKDAPHPNAARVFINWLLSPEGQEAYARTVSAMPLRKDMPDYTPERVRLAPKKILNRTWEAAEQSNKDLKSGLVEQVFGKK
ncbi:MAG: extracellular solute-binding protein [Chloroflexi bacterium]|nr:extracellular solute-binding protein [Chloroflexota bacterium]